MNKYKHIITLFLTIFILISNTSEARRVRGKQVVLSTGLKVQKITTEGNLKNPFQRLFNDMLAQVKWRGKTDQVVQDILTATKQFLMDKFGISSQPVEGNIVPFSQLRRVPAFSRTYSFMTTFYNSEQGHTQIFINSELMQKHSDSEFVRGIIHEVLTFALQPDEFFSLSSGDPEGLLYATETGRYKLLFEGFANFFTEVPYTLEKAKRYADALRDKCFASLFPDLDEGRIELIRKQDWYRNAHPLGLIMFDVFSRVNPDAMWEYARTFYNRILDEDINLVSIANINTKEILYQDYVSLCRLAGEEPYPRYVFFED